MHVHLCRTRGMTKEQIRQRLLNDLADEGIAGYIGAEGMTDHYADLLTAIGPECFDEVYDATIRVMDMKLTINEIAGRNCYQEKPQPTRDDELTK